MNGIATKVTYVSLWEWKRITGKEWEVVMQMKQEGDGRCWEGGRGTRGMDVGSHL